MSREDAKDAQSFLRACEIRGVSKAEAHEQAERIFHYREVDYHYPLTYRIRRFVNRIVTHLAR